MSKLIITVEDAIRMIRQQCHLPDWIEVQIGEHQTNDVKDDQWYDVSLWDQVDPPKVTKHYPRIDVMYTDGEIEYNVQATEYRWNKLGTSGDIIKFRKAQ